MKEGAIILTGPEIPYADEKPLNPLTLDLYLESTPTSYTLDEDDGVTCDYLPENIISLTQFAAS